MATAVLKKEKAAGRKNRDIDICGEKLASNLIRYTLPLIASGILQLLFNAADSVVVGRYAESGDTALAAVGSTGSLVNLIVNVLMGLSVGASVSVAHCFGAGDKKGVSEVVHTSMLTSLIGGIIIGAVGFFISKPCLTLMSTPEKILDQASLYLKIYFLGLPAMMVYNFASSIMRSIGDTKHPLYFLVTGGAVNVVLNLFFVIELHMSVEGVAIATVVSQVISAFLSVRHLMRTDGPHKLQLKKLKISMRRFVMIMKIGIPAGLQGTVFSISNVIIQSSVNSFGALCVTGNSAASNIEGFIYIAMNSYYHTALTFVGQHIGAGKTERIKKVALLCLLYVTVTGLVLGFAAFFFDRELLHIYIPAKEAAVRYGIYRMTVICTTYFTCGIMDSFTGFLRGMGSSVTPMVISVLGACGSRLLWIATVFRKFHTPTVLYLSYPMSWVLTVAAQVIAFFIIKKRLTKKTASAKHKQ